VIGAWAAALLATPVVGLVPARAAVDHQRAPTHRQSISPMRSSAAPKAIACWYRPRPSGRHHPPHGRACAREQQLGRICVGQSGDE
jgi:hypothetical protein